MDDAWVFVACLSLLHFLGRMEGWDLHWDGWMDRWEGMMDGLVAWVSGVFWFFDCLLRLSWGVDDAGGNGRMRV